jgi:hypothetical protein
VLEIYDLIKVPSTPVSVFDLQAAVFRSDRDRAPHEVEQFGRNVLILLNGEVGNPRG